MGIPIVRNSTLRTHYKAVERVITAMKSNLEQPMSLQAMARIACASPYHFIRTFRQVTGVPPAQFLYALRLDKARRLLMETDRKVIDICYEVGYNSVGTFTRRFTDLMGISPTSLREMAQSGAGSATDMAPANENHKGRRSFSGRVSAPADFDGIAFIGLFDTPIPQARPVACAIADAGGLYRMEDVPEGEFYLFALGLRDLMQAPESFDYQTALRAGGQAVRILRNSIAGSTYLRLRPPSPFDPPILVVMPVLIEKLRTEPPAWMTPGLLKSTETLGKVVGCA